MENLLKLCPAFMQRLWCQLAVSYTLLTFCAMMLLVIILYGVNDYNDFRSTLTLENVERRAASESLTVAQAIREPTTQWLNKARDNIRDKLTNIEHGSGTSIYRITNSSRPEVYIQIYNRNEFCLISDPIDFPRDVKEEFLRQKEMVDSGNVVRWLEVGGPIWLSLPIHDRRGEKIGTVQIFYVAKFNLWVQFKSIFDFLVNTWSYVFSLCVPIGIACGLLAARYVTKQLEKINEVTESWRQGKFEVQIALPTDDVLIRHSQYLNEMAQDLELFMNLKQNLAVTDERNRVARELHDTVKQKLFALGLQLATAKTKSPVMEAAGEQILEAEAITRETQHDLMEIITQLRPTGTSDTLLRERVGLIVEDFRRRFDVTIDISRFDSVRFNPQAEQHAVRIVQESLINAVRHGGATKVEIVCKVHKALVELKILDNGCGFDTRKETDGFGLTSMRDRALTLAHGTFDIQSKPDAGTQITISWKNEL